MTQLFSNESRGVTVDPSKKKKKIKEKTHEKILNTLNNGKTVKRNLVISIGFGGRPVLAGTSPCGSPVA